MLSLVITALLFVMLGMAMPVGFALALSGAIGLYVIGGMSLVSSIFSTAPLSSVSSYELLTIPMFVLMAQFVIMSGVADDLFLAAATWVGRVRGGLAIATAIAGAGFGAISGSSTASAATLSATTIPAMLKQGYEPKLACGVVAISGTLAMLIPPSVALVLYGIVAEVNVSQLLIAGVVPGLLVTLTIAMTVWALVWQDSSRAPGGRSYSLREKIASLKVAWPMLLLFTGVTGVIYLGIATPTEAAGIGALGAFLLALKEGKVTLRATVDALVVAATTTCMILMIILGAKVFGYFFTLTQATQQIVAYIGAAGIPPYLVLVAVLAIYLVLGCLMDQIAIIILTVPVMLPLMKTLGFDPVWFGVIVVVMAEVGLVTPPVGLNVFVVHKYTGQPLADIFNGVWPHVFAHLILVALLCAFPQIILWLPSLMH
jgi:tripartite ATP-independent transporter DctM subunit